MIAKRKLEAFRSYFQDRIGILDGAMGTMIQKLNLTEKDYRNEYFERHSSILKGNHDVLSLTRPEVIEDIHRRFLEAGADVIETNTFNSNAISQKDYHLETHVYDLNVASAKLAKKIADAFTSEMPEKPRWVAGSIGPTNQTASMSPRVDEPSHRNVDFDGLVKAYTTQIEGLIDGGVDILLIETIFDTLNARAALYAAETVFENRKEALPIMVSGTITDKSGRTLSGQTLSAFMTSMKSPYVVSIGLNCAFGAKDLSKYIKQMHQETDLMLSVYPNAGLPNQLGLYEEQPTDTVDYLSELFTGAYINFVGGCCGTTPEHIRAIARAAEAHLPNKKPFEVQRSKEMTVLAGLETVTIDKSQNFINVGERTNVSGSIKFARLIREKRYEEALEIAREQVENGAQIIDVNVDDGLLDSVFEMQHFLKLIASEPEISKVPIMIDSSKWEVLEAGLKVIQGKCIVNSISLKEGEAIFLSRAKEIRKLGAAVVVMAFDELGQADTYERKIGIAKRAYDLLTQKLDFPAEDIIFDVNILAVGTGIEAHQNYAVDFIRAVRWIKSHLPKAKTSGGLSNLSFSFRGNQTVREALHAVFLYHAIEAGLDMAILNPSMVQIYDEVEANLLKHAKAVVLNEHEKATDELIQLAQSQGDLAEEKIEKTQLWRGEALDSRLSYAIVNGQVNYLEADLQEAIEEKNTPLTLIEGPLMAGMKTVGERFSSGKMFLPQVVKSARAMKKAVDFLTPHMGAVEGRENRVGKILMATVKGDVHDIGKNIVGIVLACNHFEVLDLGIMVAPEDIVAAAIKEKVDLVALSGLITPSLDEMVTVAKQMEEAGLNIPLIIGGATTSALHTGLKIAPVYGGPVIHSPDAPHAVTAAKALLNNQERVAFLKDVYENYETKIQIAKTYEPKLLSLKEARDNKPVQDFSHVKKRQPSWTGKKVVDDLKVSDLIPYIDWTFFFTAWEMKGHFPEILDEVKYGQAARELYENAQTALEKMKDQPVKGIVGIYPCYSEAEDIVIQIEGAIWRLATLRQQNIGSEHLALADFIQPKSEKIDFDDHIGMFAVTSGLAVEEWLKVHAVETDSYQGLLIKTLGDRLAEAFSEKLHERVRREWWGYVPEETMSMKEIHLANYEGIRPAFGYPCLPDHQQKRALFERLEIGRLVGIDLTESDMMVPASSVCGLYLSHPKAKYFELGHLGKDQVEDYAQRSNTTVEAVEKRLGQRIRYRP